MILTNSRMSQSPTWLAETRSVVPVPNARGGRERPGAGEDRDSPAEREPSGVFGEDLRAAFRLFRFRGGSEGVVVLGARAAFYYGLLTRLAGKRVPFVAKELLLDEPGRSPRERLKRAAQRWALRDCDRFVVYSSAERARCSEAFGVPIDRCVFVPFHTRRESAGMPLPGEGPLLAAGRSLRDYPTLARAARQCGCPLEVIAPASQRHHFEGLPEVHFLGEVAPEEYRRRLERCAGVVVPLTASGRSAGQAVLLEAMSLGKPCVATRVGGLEDYLESGITCLVHEPGDAEGLARAMERVMSDADLRCRLGRAALERARTRYSPEAHAQAVLRLVRGSSTGSNVRTGLTTNTGSRVGAGRGA